MELIATIVSVQNRCFTEWNHTQSFCTMLDYVVQLNRDATRLTPEGVGHDKLRAVGFEDDKSILQITLIADHGSICVDHTRKGGKKVFTIR